MFIGQVFYIRNISQKAMFLDDVSKLIEYIYINIGEISDFYKISRL